MTSLPDRSEPPFGGPGIWDPMPPVPPVRPPVEPDDSRLIWSKPHVPAASGTGVAARSRDTKPAKADRRTMKSTKKRSSKKKAIRRTKKAGRVKKRR